MIERADEANLIFELVQWKQYVPATWGSFPGIQNLYNNNSNNLVSANSFRDPDYLKNWRIIFSKTIVVPADNYTSQL